MWQYRLVANYKDPKFLLGRIVDKLLCCAVLIILYVGDTLPCLRTTHQMRGCKFQDMSTSRAALCCTPLAASTHVALSSAPQRPLATGQLSLSLWEVPDGAGLGKNSSPDNLINVSSLLYMYTVLPGFAAISYMPGLVLERPLYIR